MRILITGATGFVGGHLAEALLGRGDAEVVGLNRHSEWPGPLQHLAGRVALHCCDLTDGPALEQVLRLVRPDQIYHLAGYAHAGRSVQEADAAWLGNLTATRTLLEAACRAGIQPRILYASSGMVYGEPTKEDQAFDEQAELRPPNPYAASKAAADLASYQYTRPPWGFAIVRVRPFNHIGPRQSADYAAANFARQIAAIEQGRQAPVIDTLSLSSRRDLTDVRDMVQAYLLLMEHGRSGEVYNAGSGVAPSMREVLEQMLRLTAVPVEIRQQSDVLRVAEAAALRADAGKLRRECGWSPRIPLEQTLQDTVDYWRSSP